jgi:hypothetical protein
MGVTDDAGVSGSAEPEIGMAFVGVGVVEVSAMRVPYREKFNGGGATAPSTTEYNP